jgi:triacylglycerol esterase/lipase EstA (alpha/beta hydrolase family)
MDRIAAALQTVEERSADGSPVTLLAHSAGGWLSRVFLLEVSSALA